MRDPDSPSAPGGNAEAASPAAPIWHHGDFAYIAELVGPDKARRLLSDYFAFLASAGLELRQAPAASRLREIAHDLKSSSGQLGFLALEGQSRSILEGQGAEIGEAELDRWLDLVAASAHAASLALADGVIPGPTASADRAA